MQEPHDWSKLIINGIAINGPAPFPAAVANMTTMQLPSGIALPRGLDAQSFENVNLFDIWCRGFLQYATIPDVQRDPIRYQSATNCILSATRYMCSDEAIKLHGFECNSARVDAAVKDFRAAHQDTYSYPLPPDRKLLLLRRHTNSASYKHIPNDGRLWTEACELVKIITVADRTLRSSLERLRTRRQSDFDANCQKYSDDGDRTVRFFVRHILYCQAPQRKSDQQVEMADQQVKVVDVQPELYQIDEFLSTIGDVGVSLVEALRNFSQVTNVAEFVRRLLRFTILESPHSRNSVCQAVSGSVDADYASDAVDKIFFPKATPSSWEVQEILHSPRYELCDFPSLLNVYWPDGVGSEIAVLKYLHQRAALDTSTGFWVPLPSIQPSSGQLFDALFEMEPLSMNEIRAKFPSWIDTQANIRQAMQQVGYQVTEEHPETGELEQLWYACSRSKDKTRLDTQTSMSIYSLFELLDKEPDIVLRWLNKDCGAVWNVRRSRWIELSDTPSATPPNHIAKGYEPGHGLRSSSQEASTFPRQRGPHKDALSRSLRSRTRTRSQAAIEVQPEAVSRPNSRAKRRAHKGSTSDPASGTKSVGRTTRAASKRKRNFEPYVVQLNEADIVVDGVETRHQKKVRLRKATEQTTAGKQ